MEILAVCPVAGVCRAIDALLVEIELVSLDGLNEVGEKHWLIVGKLLDDGNHFIFKLFVFSAGLFPVIFVDFDGVRV